MIKINLATRKQSIINEAGGRQSGRGFLSRLPMSLPSQLENSLRNIDWTAFASLLKRLVLPLIIGSVASYLLDNYKNVELQKLQDESEAVSAQGEKTKKNLLKFKDYESIKKQLDQDEIAIRNKLGTIQNILKNKDNLTQLIVAISNTIPSGVWLTECSILKTSIQLKGTSLEFNQISDFMKNLGENSLFSDVELKGTEKLKSNEATEEASFEIVANRR